MLYVCSLCLDYLMHATHHAPARTPKLSPLATKQLCWRTWTERRFINVYYVQMKGSMTLNRYKRLQVTSDSILEFLIEGYKVVVSKTKNSLFSRSHIAIGSTLWICCWAATTVYRQTKFLSWKRVYCSHRCFLLFFHANLGECHLIIPASNRSILGAPTHRGLGSL